MRSAIFLDRDGVINLDREDSVKSLTEFHFLPHALSALRQLATTSFAIIVVTNQSIIGRGLVDSATVDDIHAHMLQAIYYCGGRIDGIYVCPHHPDDGCLCRKPKPGLLQQASSDLDLDLTRSYLIGDSMSDMDAALAAGCTPILVLTGKVDVQACQRAGYLRMDMLVARNLAAAVAMLESLEPIR